MRSRVSARMEGMADWDDGMEFAVVPRMQYSGNRVEADIHFEGRVVSEFSEEPMVVPIPDHGLRALAAVIQDHRHIVRMASEEKRRWTRMEPIQPRRRPARDRDVPAPIVFPIGAYLMDAAPTC